MSPRRIALLALAIFAVTATVAWAETNKYRGTTEGLFFSPTEREYRKATIKFKVSGNRVIDPRWEIRVECADDSHRSFVIKTHGFLTIGDDGEFAGRVATPGGTGFDRISGRIRGERASGAVRRSVRLNSAGQETAGGQSCNSGRVEWQAHEVGE